MWAPRIAELVGAFVCSIPVDHQHIALQAVDGHVLPRETPCFRDTDNLVYGKSESGGVLFGGYEPNPASRWEHGVPWEHGARGLPPDPVRFRRLMDGAARRFPFLADAGVVALVCHPDAMTPDGNPLLGPMPGVRGFWLAAGLSLNGFGGAGGLGKALAELVTAGEAEVDVQPYRPWRFGGPYTDVDFAAAAAREVYKYYYRLRYPLDVSEAGRPKRLGPLHERLESLGAVFGTKNGWERAEYFQPGRPSRRAGEEQRATGWERPPWYDRVAVEHRAVRERLGIVDMTSFGKLETSDLDVLERVCGNRIDRPVGSVIYTQLVDERGHIVGDVTVTRLAGDRFRVVTGAGAVDSDRGFLELNGAQVDDRDRRARRDRALGAGGTGGARCDHGARRLFRRASRSAPRSSSSSGSHSGSPTSASSATSCTCHGRTPSGVWDALDRRRRHRSPSATRRSTRCASRRATAPSPT